MASKRQLKRKLSGVERLDSTSDEDEPEGKLAKMSKYKEKLQIDSSSDSSDDEPLAAKSKKHLKVSSDNSKIKNSAESIKNGLDVSLIQTSEEDEVVNKMFQASKLDGKSDKIKSASNSCDEECEADVEESFTVKNKKSSKHIEVRTENRSSESEDNGLYSTSDEDESVIQKVEMSDSNEKSNDINTSDSSEDDEELSAIKNKKSSKNLEVNKQAKIISSESEGNRLDATSDEDEPVIKMAKALTASGNSNEINTLLNSSDDDDEPLSTTSKKSSNHLKMNEKCENISSESDDNGHVSSDDEPISNLTKRSKQKSNGRKAHTSSSSSKNESLAIAQSLKQKSKKVENRHVSSDDEPVSNLTKRSKQKSNGKKPKVSSNDRIEHLKKYLRLSGIHIRSYDKLFEDCKSIKSKVEKLLDILHEKGMKGRPTIEKCKKLKKKIETEKEVAELDTYNIIKLEGRPKRGLSEKNVQKIQNTEISPAKERFSRLREIIDSEESD